MKETVTLGSEHLLCSGQLAGQRVGLVCNPASITADWRHVSDAVADAPDVALAALFGPQHGFHSVVQDNMVETTHARHRQHDVPVYSLYSETREPTAEMLDGLDVLVIDLQDVGTRVYTYIYTMAHCLRAASRHDVHVIVCDRPNPIGGESIEGPMLEPGFESFVGQFPIPLRHGMTIGELAAFFNSRLDRPAQLEVIAMTGWSRAMYHTDTNLPWILPSPNLPTLDSAVVYPGGVLFEGTNLSEGRGTTRPFELLGAPWVEARAVSERLNSRQLPGAIFRPVEFEPTFQKHAGVTCGGCQLHVTDRGRFTPVAAAVAVLQAFREQDPSRFRWREPPYEYERVKPAIDILAGSSQFRKHVDANWDAADIAASWRPGQDAFATTRAPFLLYR